MSEHIVDTVQAKVMLGHDTEEGGATLYLDDDEAISITVRGSLTGLVSQTFLTEGRVVNA